ncbi:hypothetical protein MNBD_GAMMA22-1957 [hydrothermal vent metagenome]|uniref:TETRATRICOPEPTIDE REPEAT FAMILY PROTEIN n=1 Tax=hydrothermal vent metagenome TaxID=652676 RepID=A0A3B1B8S5_9ZZZZ
MLMKKFNHFYLLSYLMLFSSLCFADSKPEYLQEHTKGIKAYRQGNLIQAMLHLENSAKSGYAPSQTTLAYILDQAEENERAFKLFKKAAEKNYAAAQFGLGNMYAKGEGTTKDVITAGIWIKKSAKQYHTPAMRAYAYALEFGRLGFAKNEDLAFQWYQLCSQAQDPVCSRRLMQVYKNGGLKQAVDSIKANKLQHQLNPSSKEKN